MPIRLLAVALVFFSPFSFFLNYPSVERPVVEEDSKKILASSLFSANPNFLPIRDWEVEENELEAKAALVYIISADQSEKTGLPNLEKVRRREILYRKNSRLALPIASLTKLMTAIVAVENMDLEGTVVVSQKAVDNYGYRGGLRVNERISVRNLLYALLMESSNDAALALAEHYRDEKAYAGLMNKKAEELGLKNTFYADCSGLDARNVSTVEDIVKIVEYSFSHPIIWQILKTSVMSASSVDGTVYHYWTNTDVLLSRLPNVLGGKTGYTEEAQGCFVMALRQGDWEERGEQAEYLISVVLGTGQKFLETERLIQWVKKAYQW